LNLCRNGIAHTATTFAWLVTIAGGLASATELWHLEEASHKGGK
jgi:hypothetical protein